MLSKIIEAMEAGLREGIDDKIYAPNMYSLDISIDDPDEREYLVSFLDEEELQGVLLRYMADRGYSLRGALNLTIRETSVSPDNDKLIVTAWFERSERTGQAESPLVSRAITADMPGEMTVYAAAAHQSPLADDLTMASFPPPWAQLTVHTVDSTVEEVTVHKPMFTIGRSKNLGNDLVLAADDQVSKRHLRIEKEADGGVTLYDLATTNGTYVQGVLVYANATIYSGNEILIGRTRIIFRTVPQVIEAIQEVVPPQKPCRLVDTNKTEHILVLENELGSAETSSILLEHPAATRQARIFSHDGKAYFLEDLAADGSTLLNGRPVMPTMRIRLRSTDILMLGGTKFEYRDAEE